MMSDGIGDIYIKSLDNPGHVPISQSNCSN